mmetsp:Transcript_5111/g.16135  ORF Transcript_5111/g.16135 Transcript_5111/m.16135 type:complete len:462 (+) Transcript_5111:242-1627(+)
MHEDLEVFSSRVGLGPHGETHERSEDAEVPETLPAPEHDLPARPGECIDKALGGLRRHRPVLCAVTDEEGRHQCGRCTTRQAPDEPRGREGRKVRLAAVRGVEGGDVRDTSPLLPCVVVGYVHGRTEGGHAGKADAPSGQRREGAQVPAAGVAQEEDSRRVDAAPTPPPQPVHGVADVRDHLPDSAARVLPVANHRRCEALGGKAPADEAVHPVPGVTPTAPVDEHHQRLCHLGRARLKEEQGLLGPGAVAQLGEPVVCEEAAAELRTHRGDRRDGDGKLPGAEELPRERRLAQDTEDPGGKRSHDRSLCVLHQRTDEHQCKQHHWGDGRSGRGLQRPRSRCWCHAWQRHGERSWHGRGRSGPLRRARLPGLRGRPPRAPRFVAVRPPRWGAQTRSAAPAEAARHHRRVIGRRLTASAQSAQHRRGHGEPQQRSEQKPGRAQPTSRRCPGICLGPFLPGAC